MAPTVEGRRAVGKLRLEDPNPHRRTWPPEVRADLASVAAAVAWRYAGSNMRLD
jgi:hypothetical protein